MVILYTPSPDQHHSQILACKDNGYDVLKMDMVIDNHFIQHLEYKLENVSFVRVDADTPDHLIQKDEQRESVLSESDLKKVEEIFTGVLSSADAMLSTKALSPEAAPVLITRPEFMRRMKEMQAFQGMQGSGFPDSYNVVVNTNHPLICGKLLKTEGADTQKEMAAFLLQLALLQQGMLKGEALSAFTKKSLSLIME